ncbi:MAG: hypothetical protein AAF564_03950 [Bacteroidota bacterium]
MKHRPDLFKLRTLASQCVLCMALLMLCLGSLHYEAHAQQVSPRVVEVRTNMSEAMVYADSVYLGRALDKFFALPSEATTLRLVPPNLDSWSMSPIIATLDEKMADSLQLTMNFQYHYRVESVPYDALIFVETPGERSLLGETPLLYAVDDPIRGMLLVTKEGYEPLRLTPGEKIWNQHYITLEEKVDEEQLAKAFWRPGDKSTRWIDYLAGGMAVASGVMAIRFKTKADRRYARYELSGDPSLRPGFERFDRYAAISLGTMQVGLGVLAVRFVIK